MSSAAPSHSVRTVSKVESASSPFLTVRFFHHIANFADTHGWLLFAVISLGCGWGCVHTMVTRHLDHDELFTFYIAQAPTLRQLFQTSHTIDLHPPLGYLLVRASFAFFGASSWSCRLPFLLAFVMTTVFLFCLVRDILSPLYALIATLLLWSTSFVYLAREARPYSLLLCFTAAILLGWHRATEAEGSDSRRWTLAIVTAGGFGLLLSHVLGVAVYAAFFGGELLRFWIRHKSDWRLWMALTVPLISILTYLPLIRNQSTILYPEQYRATPLRMASFYWESIRFVTTPLVLIALLALLWPVFQKKTPAAPSANPRPMGMPFAFLLAAFALVTVAIGILFARTGTAVFDRYIVVWLIPLVVVPALAMGYRTRCNRLAGAAVVVLLAVFFFFNNAGKPWLVGQVSNFVPAKAAAKLLLVVAPPPLIPGHNLPIPPYLQTELAAAHTVSHLETIAPELPLVANTALTFMEFDRQESAQAVERLYMLTDQEAASSIAHDTVFAHYDQVKEAFPVIRGKIEPYRTFISAHPHFLVIGTYNNPQGWLLRKLDRDGAKLHVIGTCAGYTEDCQIYEVSVESEKSSAQP